MDYKLVMRMSCPRGGPLDHADRQQAFGLYGALIIDPKDPTKNPKADIEYVIQLQEWLERGDLTYPAMLMEGGLPNYFTINGKAYPATDVVRMKVGQTIKLRFIGSNNNFIHPMHVHGGPFVVVARDGELIPESARFRADTIKVGPGQRYDVIWTARRPGKWLIHCHIPHDEQQRRAGRCRRTDDDSRRRGVTDRRKNRKVIDGLARVHGVLVTR